MRFGKTPPQTHASHTANQSSPRNNNPSSQRVGCIGGDSYRNSVQRVNSHRSGTNPSGVPGPTIIRNVASCVVAIAGMLLIALAPFASCSNDAGVDETSRFSGADHAQRPVDAEIDPSSPLASGLIGSKHDFSQSAIHARDMCTPCHVPHIPPARAPLLDSRPEAKGRYRPYNAAGTDLDATSMLCLSCHDGVIATDVFTAAHGTQWNRQTIRSPFGGGGATGHPIGIRYPTSSKTYHSEASVLADGAIKLPAGRIQCISCHDPHNTERHDGMLVKSNAGSRLCLSCHRL